MMFRSFAVLLAVSALAVLVQSGDQDEFPVEHMSTTLTSEYRHCVRRVATQLEQSVLGGAMQRILATSRSVYRESFAEVLLGEPNLNYLANTKMMGLEGGLEGCIEVSTLFQKFTEDPDCKQFYGDWLPVEFLMDVLNQSEAAKQRIEVYYACIYAGFLGVYKAPENRYSLCVHRVATQLQQFVLESALTGLLNASRTYYPFYITDILLGRQKRSYQACMRRNKLPENEEDCKRIMSLFRLINEDAECRQFYDNGLPVEFLMDVANQGEQAKMRIEVYYACTYAWHGRK